jgi:hypothetical protein
MAKNKVCKPHGASFYLTLKKKIKKNKVKRCIPSYQLHIMDLRIQVSVHVTSRTKRKEKKTGRVRALAADFQPFSLYLGNKTTFCFPIKKYPTIDSFTFPYIN